jgi:hypothetical protein
MPLIQIEQDSPSVSEGARRRLVEMGENVRMNAHYSEIQHSVAMHEIGFLAALLIHRLLSHEVYSELFAELEKVLDAAMADG